MLEVIKKGRREREREREETRTNQPKGCQSLITCLLLSFQQSNNHDHNQSLFIVTHHSCLYVSTPHTPSLPPSLYRLMCTPLISTDRHCAQVDFFGPGAYNAGYPDPSTTMIRFGSGARVLLLSVFLAAFVGSSAAAAGEKEILLRFKAGVTGDPYGRLSSWAPNADPCRHYRGVSCNPAGFVVKILLWNTSLSGVLSPALSGLMALRIVSLFGNRFSGNIPHEFAGLRTLWKMNLSSNALSGSIPEFLGDLPNIRLLDLSKNGYAGEIPSGLFKFCYKTKFVSLSHNRLSGSIPESIGNCSSLSGFDFSYNNLTGGLPSEVRGIPNLAYLSVRSNALSGDVEEQVSGCHSLELLDLSTNAFTGSAPFGVLGFDNLTQFNVSHNGFGGTIPEIPSCSGGLEILDASGNGLEGKIPASIANCGSLRLLDLGLNRLSGKIPVEIVKLGSLVVLSLGDNSIEGTIPDGFGSIELLQVLDLQNLKLIGEIPGDVCDCKYLLQLDVSGNALSAQIPQALYNLTNLKFLDLNHNQLNGSIPPSMGSLSHIQFLDLSQNSLSGPIPPSLGNLTKLTHFNLSYNHLSGTIPPLSTIQHFGPTAFSHNSGLCGLPLDPCPAGGNGTTTLSSGKSKPLLTVPAIIFIVAAALILIGVCLTYLVSIMARRRRREVEVETMVVGSTPLGSTESNVVIGKLVLFGNSLPSKYGDWESGAKALLDKECLVGVGSIGMVYKANFEGGVSIAVKKLETLGKIRNQDEFEHEVARLGNLHHPNLVTFQGYYWSSTMQLILSEFVSNGSLFDNLHGLSYPGTSTSIGNTELSWSRRFGVALGTARALAYLHHDCKPQVLHLNIKSSNILLDDKYRAKLSDYGLQELLPISDNYSLTMSHMAVGYVAPELAQSLRPSDKCDVYSFGVILLELVTGRRPVESPSANEVVILCEYVRAMLVSGTTSDCFDRRLRGGFTENELIQVLRLGLICTAENPSRRPSMAEVVQILESIRSGSDSQ